MNAPARPVGRVRRFGLAAAISLAVVCNAGLAAAQTATDEVAETNVVTTYEADPNAPVVQTMQADSYQAEELSDPIEPVNRAIYGFNDAVDTVLLRPVAEMYRAVVPSFLRTGIYNVISNATSPITLVNDVLQGEGKRAEETLVRFLVNTTVGFGGFVDAAQHAGIEPHTEDFAQTLAVYGVPSGPYIVAPIIGPSTPRHLFGRVVDAAANPFTWLLMDATLLESSSPLMAEVVTTREANLDQLDALRESSPDFYATLKDVYYQRRLAEIRNGRVVEEDLPDIPEFSR